MKIDYELIDLKGEIYTDKIESYIELTNTCLYWKAKYYADVLNSPDDLLSGWKNRMKCMHSYVKRESVMHVGITYMTDDLKWQVYIDANGLAGSIEIYFQREREAEEFAEKIVNWMVEKT